MAEGKKSRKVGRGKRNGQNLKYRNERRCEQNQLRRLRRTIKARGVTGQDVIKAVHRCETVLGLIPLSKLEVNKSKKARVSFQSHWVNKEMGNMQ